MIDTTTLHLAIQAETLVRMDGERLERRSCGRRWDILGPDGELREEALDPEDLLELLTMAADHHGMAAAA